MMKRLPIVLVFAICLQIVLVIYLSRAVFLEPYEVDYWKDRFEHSQWQLPLSRRTIGDDGLYSHIGYELANGKDPTYSSPEVPPVGKYLIGWSIKYFGHYVWYTFLSGVVCIVLFFIISSVLLRNMLAACTAVLLLVFDPLFFSQFTVSLLDVTQLFFLLLTIVFTLLSVRSKSPLQIVYIIGSGLSLGLMAQTKIPLTVPIIAFLLLYYFWLKGIRLSILAFAVALCVGFLLPYSSYFHEGHSLNDFFGIVRYTIGYYRQSALETHIGAIFEVIAVGNFPHITSGEKQLVTEWTLLWPLSLCVVFLVFLRTRKLLTIELKGIVFYVLIALCIYSIIPLYPRYLIIVLPFLYLVAASQIALLPRISAILFIFLMLIYGFNNTIWFYHRQHSSELNAYFYNFSHQFFHDVYQQSLNKEHMPTTSREWFHNEIHSDFNEAQIRYSSFEEHSRKLPLIGDNGYIIGEMTYYTQHLGTYTEAKKIPLTKVNGRWLVDWQWNLVMDGYNPEYSFKSQIKRGRRGSIISSENHVLAQDIDGYLISIRPDQIDLQKEENLLNFVSSLTAIKAVHIQNAYLENPLKNTPIPVGSIVRRIEKDELIVLRNYPGVYLDPYETRLYSSIDPHTIANSSYSECCTRLYSATNYHGVDSYEATYDVWLAGNDGGKLILHDEKNEPVRVILEKEPTNGVDIQL